MELPDRDRLAFALVVPACLILLLAVSMGSACFAADYLVLHARDAGAGSLRQAMLDANRAPGADRIRFDSTNGRFAEPQTITLESPLPSITDDLEIDGYIDDRLWVPSGVTIDGVQRFRIFHVAPGVRVRLRYLGITGGRAIQGGGLLSEGDAVLEAMMVFRNHADVGGGLAQRAGRLRLINSTFWNNRAAKQGGGLDLQGQHARLTHCTLNENHAPVGAGLRNAANLEISNSILANSSDGEDCHSSVPLLSISSHNLIERSEGCGEALLTADPRLGDPGLYNGPTISIPLEVGSPAINWADNTRSLDAIGAPLVWDQRGNGDPRFAAGIADLGAFEEQAITVLDVDVSEDIDLRGCSSAPKDCSLRGAIAIANASDRHGSITFNVNVFGKRPRIELLGPLPQITRDVSMSAKVGQDIEVIGSRGALRTLPGIRVRAVGVALPSN